MSDELPSADDVRGILAGYERVPTVEELEEQLRAERQRRERLQGALSEARDALLTYMQGESGLPFTEPYGAVRKALGYIDAALSENGNGGTDGE